MRRLRIRLVAAGSPLRQTVTREPRALSMASTCVPAWGIPSRPGAAAPGAYSGCQGWPTLRTATASSGRSSLPATWAATGMPPRARKRLLRFCREWARPVTASGVSLGAMVVRLLGLA